MSGGNRKAGCAFKVIVLLLFIAIAAAIAAAAFLVSLNRATGAVPDDGLLFEIAKGDSGGFVAEELERRGIVRSALFFRALLRLEGAELDLKAGRYRIPASATASDALDILRSGRQELLRLVIPEGVSLKAVAGIVGKTGSIDPADFVKAASDRALLSSLGIRSADAEGYLFPETYFIPYGMRASDLVSLMVGTFRERLEAKIPEAASLSAAELRDRVIMASIVEREYRAPEEARVMAGVFYNRMRIRMPLQSCATVVYIMTERQGKPHPARLWDSDVEVDDPYNTYVNRGLPPGPICSPGLVALDAAFRPAVSRYLFFRLIDERRGEHYFSETFDEHIRAATLAVKP